MIQLAQLDSSTLSLWIDTSSISSSPNAAVYETVIAAACRGDVEGVAHAGMTLESKRGRIRALHLASLVWHEQRHFLDLIFTNYGARRLRHHASIYQNLFALVGGQRYEAGSPLVLPIRFHRDPYVAFKGIDTCEALDRQIIDIDRRIALEKADTIELPFGDRDVRVGGEQVLEALGFLHQHWSVGHLSSGEMNSLVLEDLPPKLRRNGTYEWPISLLGPLFGDSREEVGSYPVHPGARLISAILIGSVMAPYMSASTDLVGVTARLSHLVVKLSNGAGKDLRDAPFVDCWKVVDEIVARTWGRGLADELELDIVAANSKWVAPLIDRASEGIEVEVAAFVQNYHRLRVGLLERLRNDGPEFLDPTRGPDMQGDAPCLPIPVSITARGRSVVPEDHVAVFADRVSLAEQSSDNEISWAWGWAPRVWPPEECSDSVSFTRDRSWMSIVSIHAPAAKLMLNGYRHRTMLGPELMKAHEFLKQLHDVEMHALYNFSPAAGKDLDQLCFLAEKHHLTCDVCGRDAGPEDGHLVSATELRSNEDSTEAARAAYVRASGDHLFGELQMLSDWSPWVTCHTCIDLLAPRRKSTREEVVKLREAADELRGAAALSADFAEVSELADAYVLQRTGRFEEAVGRYRSIASRRDPETVSTVAFSWGLLSESLRRPDEALSAYELAMHEQTPAPSAKAAYNAGLLHSRQGRPRQAIECFGRAAEIDDPEVTVEALCKAGELLQALGSEEQAASAFEAAYNATLIEEDGDQTDGRASVARAIQLRDEGRQDEALSLLHHVLLTGHPAVQMGAALSGLVCAVEVGDKEKGLAFAQKVLDEGDEEAIRLVKKTFGLE